MLPHAKDETSWFQRVKDEWGDSLRAANRCPRDPVAGWATFALGTAICAFLFWRNLLDIHHPMDFNEYNLLNTACILWLPLFLVLVFLRRDPAEFGMTVGDGRAGTRFALAAFALFAPVILIAAASPDAQNYYLGWMGQQGGSQAVASAAWTGGHFNLQHVWIPEHLVPEHVDAARLAYHELVMGFYMFGWEFFFRGFLLNGFRRFLPLWGAIVLQAAFFTALHYGKPIPEMISSFPGGILMALLAIRCRSFVPCFLLHFLISAGFDGAVLLAHFHPYLPHFATAAAHSR